MQENQISHVLWTFLLLTEEDMASCSRAFRKPESAEEERNLNENAIPKSTRCSDEIVRENFWNSRMVGKTKIQRSSLAPSQLTSLTTLGHWYNQYDGWVTEFLAGKICRRTVQSAKRMVKGKFTVCEIDPSPKWRPKIQIRYNKIKLKTNTALERAP